MKQTDVISLRKVAFQLQRREKLHFAGLAAGYLAGCIVYLPVLIPWAVHNLMQFYEEWPSINLSHYSLMGPVLIALIHGVIWVLAGSLISDYQMSRERLGLWEFLTPSLYLFGILLILGMLFSIVDLNPWRAVVFAALGFPLSLELCISLYAYWWVAIRIPRHLMLQIEGDEEESKSTLSVQDH